MSESREKIYKRDFWAKENLKYAQPHFRLEKAARIINRIARGRECSMLDIGCGPAAVSRFLDSNVQYHGMDIAIQEPAPNLIQADLLEEPIRFGGERFDVVLAQGFFEYAGKFQDQKFAEIKRLLKEHGVFIVSYVNFGHWLRFVYSPYNNVQSIKSFRRSLARNFSVEMYYPTSHNWNHSEPSRNFMKASQMNLKVNIPFVSPMLAVEYFFICTLPAD
jgi:predicted TPR repeat methyltransferase